MAERQKGNGRAKRRGRKESHDFMVVGIGASAGGIEALEQLFENMPEESGMAFVVILHLSPEHESNLAGLLQRKTSMPVIMVTESVKVEPGHVYVIPPAKHLVMTDGHVGLQEPEWKKGDRVPVDIFFRTLAEAYDVKSVGVVLSGTGADGTLGLRHIKEAGGVSIAQEPQEAEYADMPRSAITSGMVDFVLPVGNIPQKLVSLRRISERIQTPPETDKPLSEADARALREVLTILRTRTGNDFSHYKRSTVLRRITRRLQVNALEDVTAYANLLRERPEETRDLMSDMVISVTNFFRDFASFRVLEEKVVPKLFENKGEGEQVRVWVPGCATGEESYSIAILLLECAHRLAVKPSIQIFATDINQQSINEAREGLYPESISADVSPERLARFFNKEHQFYRIKKEVRDVVLFAPHNILRDPPFSKLDLVSCRNLLIYLNRDIQERVLELFHFVLKPEGYLFLGASESADSLLELFLPREKKHRIFKRRPVVPGKHYFPSTPLVGKWEMKSPETKRANHKAFSFGELHHQLLEHYAPPSVLINSDHDIVHLSESAGRFLTFGGGEPSRNLIKTVSPELRLDLRAALLAASEGEKPVESRRVLTSLDGEKRLINIRVQSIDRPDAARGFMLVLFEEVEPFIIPDPGAAPQADSTSAGEIESVVRQMEDELTRTKDQLRFTVEQYETSNEELKASNEELQAINEELRSTSEELETSREEMQSLNEELRTVNHELKEKIDELGRSNADLQNLLAATDIGTIFLGRDLSIKRYTPNIRQLFNIIPSDLQRPLAHLTHKLEYEKLPEDAERVLLTLTRTDREVRSTDGRWYIARILPYRTTEDRIDGVVITFVDITERKLVERERERLQAELMRERALKDAVVEQMPAGVVIADAASGKMIFANGQADRIWREAMNLPGDDKRYSEYPGYFSDGRPYETEQWPMWRSINLGETVRDEEIEIKRGDDTRGTFSVSSSPVRDQNGEIIAGVVTFYDVTAQKRVNAGLLGEQSGVRALFKTVRDYAIFTIDVEGRIKSWNPGAEVIFGYSESEVIDRHTAIIFTPEDRENGVPEMEMSKALATGRAEDERWHLRKDGSRFYASGVMTSVQAGNDSTFIKILSDLTARKRMEETLRRSRDELEERVKERTREIKLSYEALELEIAERRSADEQIKELLRRIVNTQELERRRIARDLHDQLGQQLTALRLSLESLKEQSKGHKGLLAQVETLQAAAERLDKDVDFLAWELRPSTLDELGLSVTVENFVHEWSEHFNIPAQFHTAGLTGIRLTTEAETNLYRIAQEALNNVYKHARAGRVDVILEQRDKNVVLIVEDDGQGFDSEEEVKGLRGLGLISMRERAALSGGTLEIQSTPGEGTTIFARVPYLEPGSAA